ncbi:MAG: hypothetical protein ACKPJD_15570, partial [Planctomycetaceae bacterium]
MLAFVYSLGGVDERLLWSTLWLVFWECLLFGSIGLMCSAWYTTTVGAFVASYVLSAVLFTLTRLVPGWIPTPWMIWQVVDGMSGNGFAVWNSGVDGPLRLMMWRFPVSPVWCVLTATVPT